MDEYCYLVSSPAKRSSIHRTPSIDIVYWTITTLNYYFIMVLKNNYFLQGPSRIHSMSGNRDPVYTAACLQWQTRNSAAAVTVSSRAGFQKVWDAPVLSQTFEEVLSGAQYQAGRDRLIAVSSWRLPERHSLLVSGNED